MISKENLQENKGEKMGTLITIVSLILFIVLYIFTSNRLSEYDTKEKIKIYFIGLVISLTITMLILTI